LIGNKKKAKLIFLVKVKYGRVFKRLNLQQDLKKYINGIKIGID